MKKVTLLSLCLIFSCVETSDKSKLEIDAQVIQAKIIEPTEALQFFNKLKSLCGNSFEGQLISPKNDEQFGGKSLVMHIKSCDDKTIKIPFFVGDDKSRTWVLTYQNDRILLKHDHRHKDGSEDEVTMYGGKTTNSGQVNIQTFPADQETKEMIPAASTNIWWITLDDNQFTYNLRRLGTDRLFTVAFDLTKTIENPESPWGWED